jgi:hypothetical protein
MVAADAFVRGVPQDAEDDSGKQKDKDEGEGYSDRKTFIDA